MKPLLNKAAYLLGYTTGRIIHETRRIKNKNQRKL